MRGQRAVRIVTVTRIGGLSIAAAAGAFDVQGGRIDAFGFVALVTFVVAIGAEIYLLSEQPDRLWYHGRAAAESVKTVTWRYVSGGHPFPSSLNGPEADVAMLARVGEITADVSGLDVVPIGTADRQITPSMRQMRAMNLENRKRLYEDGRIEEQRRWYAVKAAENARRARQWSVLLLVVECAGVVAAALKAFQVVDVDVLGALGAVGAAMVAWTQAKQHRQLSRAYSVAAQELATIKSLFRHDMDETGWARFVADAEDAISREHTSWRASRGANLPTGRTIH